MTKKVFDSASVTLNPRPLLPIQYGVRIWNATFIRKGFFHPREIPYNIEAYIRLTGNGDPEVALNPQWFASAEDAKKVCDFVNQHGVNRFFVDHGWDDR